MPDKPEPLRLTPAYAGNTDACRHTRAHGQAHPRLRGEHDNIRAESDAGKGSPPPTRGTPLHELTAEDFQRLTPAYAGNTDRVLHRGLQAQAHPRLRGEHSMSHVSACRPSGSPPPTRGTRELVKDPPERLRLTPAYAGNTCQDRRGRLQRQAHPRLRGEHPSAAETAATG